VKESRAKRKARKARESSLWHYTSWAMMYSIEWTRDRLTPAACGQLVKNTSTDPKKTTCPRCIPKAMSDLMQGGRTPISPLSVLAQGLVGISYGWAPRNP
jgi:hypothetical protein